jgi:hypothetical protein
MACSAKIRISRIWLLVALEAGGLIRADVNLGDKVVSKRALSFSEESDAPEREMRPRSPPRLSCWCTGVQINYIPSP